MSRRDVVIKNANRVAPIAPKKYEPQYSLLGIDPGELTEPVNQEEIKQAIAMQTLGAISRKTKPIITAEQRELDERYINNIHPSLYPLPKTTSPLIASNLNHDNPIVNTANSNVVESAWYASGDISARDVANIPSIQPTSDWLPIDVAAANKAHINYRSEDDVSDDILEVELIDQVQQVPEDEYFLQVGKQMISVPSKSMALELIEHILDSEDPEYQSIDLKDLFLFKRLSIKFGFNIKD